MEKRLKKLRGIGIINRLLISLIGGTDDQMRARRSIN